MNNDTRSCCSSGNQTIERRDASRDAVRPAQPAQQTYRAPANVVETATGYQITLDTPGASRDGIDIQVHDGVLSVVAPVAPRSPQNARPIVREYGVGDFRRQFRIGEDIDADGITASYNAGVLTIDVPKARRAEPRRVPVNAS